MTRLRSGTCQNMTEHVGTCRNVTSSRKTQNVPVRLNIVNWQDSRCSERVSERSGTFRGTHQLNHTQGRYARLKRFENAILFHSITPFAHNSQVYSLSNRSVSYRTTSYKCLQVFALIRSVIQAVQRDCPTHLRIVLHSIGRLKVSCCYSSCRSVPVEL